MNPKFIDILRCPKSGDSLRLKAVETSGDGMVITGTLVAEPSGHQYPIVRGIPRFVEEELYTGSFGYEWRKWARVQFESENAGGAMRGHTQRMFEEITDFPEESLRGKLVVEFGCGPGRFLDIVRRKGGIAIGIDMSVAVESARENFAGDSEVLIVQGDILQPPFKEGAFDAGYSLGVLHHTPAPAQGFQKLARLIKDGGLIACCVYSKQGFYGYPSVYRYRRLHNAAKSVIGNKAALGYAYFSAYVLYPAISRLRKSPVVGRVVNHLESYYLVNADIPDAKWRVLDVFDAITPFYASTHTAEEVRCWFDEAGCHNLRQKPWGTAFTAVKGGDDE